MSLLIFVSDDVSTSKILERAWLKQLQVCKIYLWNCRTDQLVEWMALIDLLPVFVTWVDCVLSE